MRARRADGVPEGIDDERSVWGGATLPYLVGRFEKGDEVELPSRRRITAHPLEYLRRIYYECITYDLGALRYLISVAGADGVLFGRDWPHQVHDVAGSLANTAALPARPCRPTSATRSGAPTRSACSA